MFRPFSKVRSLRFESLEERKMLTVANFSLTDINPTSATFGTAVSPTDFEGEVSGWYFGRST